MKLSRRGFLALPFVAPFAAAIAKATPAPKPEHYCWECNCPVYGDRGFAQNHLGSIFHLKDGLPGDHVLCPDCRCRCLYKWVNEVDAYADDGGGEGNPIELAIQRNLTRTRPTAATVSATTTPESSSLPDPL